MEGDDNIIDLVQSNDGTYAVENEIVAKPKRGRKSKAVVQKEFHEEFDEFLDGVEEGKKFLTGVFKAFGV
jgi:hypothetical protein